MDKKYIRILRNATMAGVLALLPVALASCDQDHKPNWSTQDPVEFQKTAVSVEEGAEVPLTLDTIRVTYPIDIVLNSLAPVTLNGSSVNAVAVGSELRIPVSLTTNKQYTLEVSDRTVAGVGSSTFAPGFKLNFHTALIVSNIQPLTNAAASDVTKRVYEFLVAQHGEKILSGCMANVNNNNDFAKWIYEVTQKYVAITGYDFIHLPEAVAGQSWVNYDIDPARSQWDNNGLVSYMWHWRVPDNKEAYENKDFTHYGCRVPGDGVEDPVEFDIREALKEGTWENQCILADIDEVAKVFKELEVAGIPVIWRPLHEAAGSYRYSGAWFWWGRYGDEYTIELWKLLRSRLEDVHGLTNLIWVWTAQYESGYEAQMNASYPGNNYVDVVGVDIYADTDDSQIEAYNAVNSMVDGKKLVTISETGLIQNPDKCLADGADWSWFNLWYTYDIDKNPDAEADGFGNTADWLRTVMNNPLVITRDQMPSLK